MENNPDKIDRIYIKMLMRKSGQERMMMGFSMFGFSAKILMASLKEEIPARDLKRNIFLRLYGNDFDGKDIEKIIKYFN